MVSLIGGSNVNALEVRLEGDATDLENTLADAAANIRRFKTMVVTAGTAMAVAGAAGIAKATAEAERWNEVQREMLKTTDSVEVTEELSKSMRDLSSEIPIAVEDLGMLAAEAARFGIRGQDNIDAFVESVAKMAAATDLSTDRAAEAFAKLATLTNTPVKEMENLGSSIAILENTMATSADEIVKNSLRSSAELTNLGMHQSEIMAIAAALNESSHSARRAGTQLRRLAQDMMDPRRVETFAEALGVTEEEFLQMRDSDPSGTLMKTARLMNEGGDAADTLNSNLTSVSRRALQALGQNLEDTNGALQRSQEHYDEATQLQREFEIQTDSLYDRIQLLRNVINDIAISIGNVFVPKLENLVDRMIPVLDNFNDWVKAGGDVRVAMTMLGMVIGGVIPVIAFFAQVLGPLKPLMLGVALASASLAKTFALVAAPVVAFGVAWRKNVLGIGDQMARIGGVIGEEVGKIIDTFKTMVGDVLSVLDDQFGDATGAARKHLRKLVRLIADKVIFTIRQLGKIIRGVLEAIAPLVRETVRIMNKLWERHGDTIMRMAEKIERFVIRVKEEFLSLEGASNTLMRALIPVALAFTIIGGKLGLIIGAVIAAREAWANNFMGIRDKTFEALQQIEDIFFKSLNKIDAIVNQTLDELEALWAKHGEDIMQTLSDIVGEVKRILVTGYGAAVRTLKAIISPIIEGLQRIWENHGDRIVRILRKLGNLMLNIFGAKIIILADIVRRAATTMIELWEAHGSAIVTELSGWIDTIMRAVNLLLTAVLPIVEAFLDIINGLFEKHGGKIMKIWGLVFKTLEMVVTNALDIIITTVLVFSRTLRGIIDTLMLVLQGNWGEAWDRLKQTAANVAPLISGLVKRVFGRLVDWFMSWGGWIIKAIVGAFNSVRDSVRTAVGNIRDSIHNRLRPVIDFISTWGTLLLKVLVAPFYLAYKAIQKAITSIYNGIIQPFLGRIMDAWAVHGDEITREVNEIWSSVTERIRRAVSIIKAVVLVITHTIERVWNTVKLVTKAVLHGIIIPVITDTWETIKDVTQAVWNAIGDEIMLAMRTIKTIIKVASLFIRQKLETAWGVIKAITLVAWHIIETTIISTVNSIMSVVGPWLSLLKGQISDTMNLIWTIIKTVWEGILTTVEVIAHAIFGTIRIVLNLIQGDWEGAWNAMMETIFHIWDTINSFVEGALSDLFAEIKGFAVRTIIRVTTFVNNFLTLWNDMVTDIIDSTADFISDMIDSIATFLSDLWDEFWSFATDLIFGSLIDDMWNEVLGVTEDILGTIKETVSDVLGKIKEIFSDILGKIKEIVSENISKAKDAVAGGLNTMKDKVRSKLERIVGIFSSKFDKVKSIAEDIMGKARSAARTASRKLSDAKSAARKAASTASDTVSSGVSRARSTIGLSSGGIVTGPTQAVIGEAGDSEAVIPLNSQGKKFLADAIGDTGGKGVNIEELNVNASSYAEGRAAARGFKDELRSHNFD